MKPKTIWVLFDLSNSNPRSKNYLWWFETRELAREHRNEQHAMKYGATLSQPQKYVMPNAEVSGRPHHGTEKE